MPSTSGRFRWLLYLALIAGTPGVVAQPGAGGSPARVTLLVLGTVQDGGSPHPGCQKSCCTALFEAPDPGRLVVSLGLVDENAARTYLFEATPDLVLQMARLQQALPLGGAPVPDGIFLTHAHMGHYSGLMYLGREALNARGVPVYALPGMEAFLSANGPWDQLVELGNIRIVPMAGQVPVRLTERLQVIPFRVPHRDEYSETAGFEILGPNKRALFIPDIDKWERWETSIVKKLEEVDLAFLDATFFDAAEIGYRDLGEIPHPFVVETMALFEALPRETREKIHFIHLNHTNPLLDPQSGATKKVLSAGYRVARVGDRFQL